MALKVTPYTLVDSCQRF